MRNEDPYGLKKLSIEEVCKWIAGWNNEQGHGMRLIGQNELRRRLSRPEAIRSWIAIAISALALVIAALK
jgi:hypothetical protein